MVVVPVVGLNVPPEIEKLPLTVNALPVVDPLNVPPAMLNPAAPTVIVLLPWFIVEV